MKVMIYVLSVFGLLAFLAPCRGWSEETMLPDEGADAPQEDVLPTETVTENGTIDGETPQDAVAEMPGETSMPEEKSFVLPPTVVSASTMALSVAEVASSVTIITAEMIEARKAQDLQEIIQGVAGIDLAQNGGPGQLGSLFMRGATSERTLILINGVPLNDPMSPARNTDVSRISLDNVEQIEVVRGPQSVVFGSGAMGGVVNIITRKKTDQPGMSLTMEGGKYGSWLGKILANGSAAGVQVSLGASLEGTEGFSSAQRSETFAATTPVPDMENDPYRNLTLDLGMTYKATDAFNLSLSNRLSRAVTGMDAYGGDYGDDPNFVSRYTQTSHRLDAEYAAIPSVWLTRISAGLGQLDRVTDDDVDADHPYDMTRSEYRSRNFMLTWHNQLDVMEHNHLAVGVDYRQEQGMSNYYSEYLDWYTFMPAVSENSFAVRSTHAVGVYLEDQFAWQDAVLNAGVRYETHDQFGGHATFRVTPSYRVAAWGTRVKGTYGTAFNAPSLYQLYVKDVWSQGDPELEPETSSGWDAGVEQAFWQGKLSLGATYFQTAYRNQIDAPFDMSTYHYVYVNLGESEAKGWECELSAEPLEHLKLRVTYTKLTANDLTNRETTGPEPLLRRADYQMAADIFYTWQDLSAALHIGHVGPRWDTGKVMLESYTLMDLVVRYQVIPQVQAYVKLKNILDEDYVVVTGYGTARFAGYAGVKIDLP